MSVHEKHIDDTDASQQAHSLKTTSYQRRSDAMTSIRRLFDVVPAGMGPDKHLFKRQLSLFSSWLVLKRV